MFRDRVVWSGSGGYGSFGPTFNTKLYPRYFGRSRLGAYAGYDEVGLSSLLLVALVI